MPFENVRIKFDTAVRIHWYNLDCPMRHTLCTIVRSQWEESIGIITNSKADKFYNYLFWESNWNRLSVISISDNGKRIRKMLGIKSRYQKVLLQLIFGFKLYNIYSSFKIHISWFFPWIAEEILIHDTQCLLTGSLIMIIRHVTSNHIFFSKD